MLTLSVFVCYREDAQAPKRVSWAKSGTGSDIISKNGTLSSIHTSSYPRDTQNHHHHYPHSDTASILTGSTAGYRSQLPADVHPGAHIARLHHQPHPAPWTLGTPQHQWRLPAHLSAPASLRPASDSTSARAAHHRNCCQHLPHGRGTHHGASAKPGRLSGVGPNISAGLLKRSSCLRSHKLKHIGKDELEPISLLPLYGNCMM